MSNKAAHEQKGIEDVTHHTSNTCKMNLSALIRYSEDFQKRGILNREAYLLFIASPAIIFQAVSLLAEMVSRWRVPKILDQDSCFRSHDSDDRHLRRRRRRSLFNFRSPDCLPVLMFLFYAAILPWRGQAADFDALISFLLTVTIGFALSKRDTYTRREWIWLGIRVFLQTMVIVSFYYVFGGILIPDENTEIAKAAIDAGEEPFRVSRVGLSSHAFWKFQILMFLFLDTGVDPRKLGLLIAFKITKVIALWMISSLWTITEDLSSPSLPVHEKLAGAAVAKSPFLDMVIWVCTISLVLHISFGLLQYFMPEENATRARFFETFLEDNHERDEEVVVLRDAPGDGADDDHITTARYPGDVA